MTVLSESLVSKAVNKISIPSGVVIRGFVRALPVPLLKADNCVYTTFSYIKVECNSYRLSICTN